MANSSECELTKRVMGLTRYYRRFVKDYGSISKPLTILRRKEQFKWSEEADTTFQHLKNDMISPSVLALPDFFQTFIVETNASGTSIGLF